MFAVELSPALQWQCRRQTLPAVELSPALQWQCTTPDFICRQKTAFQLPGVIIPHLPLFSVHYHQCGRASEIDRNTTVSDPDVTNSDLVLGCYCSRYSWGWLLNRHTEVSKLKLRLRLNAKPSLVTHHPYHHAARVIAYYFTDAAPRVLGQ